MFAKKLNQSEKYEENKVRLIKDGKILDEEGGKEAPPLVPRLINHDLAEMSRLHD